MKLQLIQQQLKAPKDLRNEFGGYKYRSCESILESLKPLLSVHGCVLTIDDEVVSIGGWNYVKATAQLTDCETTNVFATSAYAREQEVKKGMDAAQITGAASSYARKYALNGLFAIDDTKDPDALNRHDDEATAGKTSPRAAQQSDEAIEQREASREQEARRNSGLQEVRTEMDGDWRNVVCTYGKTDGPLRGKQLGELSDKNLDFLTVKFGEMVAISPKDRPLMEALKARAAQKGRGGMISGAEEQANRILQANRQDAEEALGF